MITVGIDIDSSRVILYAIDKNDDGNFENITGEFKTIGINDEYDNAQIREFQSTLHSFFDTINPDKIAVIKRNTKGKFSAAPISFKLEGLIQCYSNCDIEFVSPQTLSAFFKKNDFVEPGNKYQFEAAKLAQYLAS